MFSVAVAPLARTYAILVRGLSLVVAPTTPAGPVRRILCSVDLAVAESGPMLADEIDSVVNYEYVVEGMRRLAAEHGARSLVDLAEHGARLCLSHPRARRVRITLDDAGTPDDAGSGGIIMERLKQITPPTGG